MEGAEASSCSHTASEGNTEDENDKGIHSSPPDSPRKPIKSTAVVKYSAVQSPANFAELQYNTDLNHPPSNWLRSSAKSYGLQYGPSHSTGFSSFRMAHMFPDCVGEVDVVSDAENIKKLLKIPYSRGPVSMVVHRVEKTLLIDEFDIHKYLLRTAEAEWQWLKTFFYEHVRNSLSDKDTGLLQKNKSRNVLQQKNLISKFLYHSLATEQTDDTQEKTSNIDVEQDHPVVVPNVPALPEPSLDEELPDPTCKHKFARNVVWTFEDIQMLIGTDMPIFGGGTHPCVSLRLRDMAKPINVLTGIDYWLDNLMCNVPEVIMCYHLDGIVQKYELIKTEDLPQMEDSKFSPKVIRDVAQNILSFLKSNATKAGHTYWLFKGKGDDVVKLYDLTSLCTDFMDDKEQNPFTVPVAMLLYRVARNMMQSRHVRKQQGTIRMLLRNCLALLNKEKYPQIATSAHYMLSDLYVPDHIDPSSPHLSDQSDDDESSINSPCEDDEEEQEESETNVKSSVEVKSLCISTQYRCEDEKYRAPSICGSVEERCKHSLHHIAEGLGCLQFFDECPEDETMKEEQSKEEEHEEKERKIQEEENPNMARPFHAIPMPYSPLKQKEARDADCKSNKTDDDSTSHSESSKSDNLKVSLCDTHETGAITWDVHLKALLYNKATLIYSTLSEYESSQGLFGKALQHIKFVLYGCHVLGNLMSSGSNELKSYVFDRTGDLCYAIVQHWNQVEVHRKDYCVINEVDSDILEEMSKEIDIEDVIIPSTIESMEKMLQLSAKCYQMAMSLEPEDQQKISIQRKLGSIENELGVLYMNQATAKYQKEKDRAEEGIKTFQLLFQKSLQHLEAGIHAFEAVRDEANLALLCSNAGRLMRLCAHFHSPVSNRKELESNEKHYYNKALGYYQKALFVLNNRYSNPVIWDAVTWELCTTLFTMATLLQDYPPLHVKSQEEVEKEVVELMLKALKHCDLETPGPQQLIYQFRAATIYRRLASLYHNSYRTRCGNDPKSRNMLQLAKLYYEKSSQLLLKLEHPSEYLRVQLERIAMAECQAEAASGVNTKVKSLRQALELALQTRPMLNIMFDKLQSVSKVPEQSSKESAERDSEQESAQGSCAPEGQMEEEMAEKKEEEKMLSMLEQRLKVDLLTLAKLSSGKNKKGSSSLNQLYKKMYMVTLKRKEETPVTMPDLVTHMHSVVSQLESLWEHADKSEES